MRQVFIDLQFATDESETMIRRKAHTIRGMKS